MYTFLRKYLNIKLANTIIVLWYVFLLFYILHLTLASIEEGKFRYIGW